jgi:alkylated DNA repair dioxygenase AlkB
MGDLFGVTAFPQGFRYEGEAVADGAQRALIAEIRQLPLQAFDFHGFKANRRVLSYGWRYDFAIQRLDEIEHIPDWLLPLREVVAQFAKAAADDFAQVLISEYAPGAGIGWHRDKDVFDRIVGVSLGASCTLRLRRRVGERHWDRRETELEPGSFYLLADDVRTDWEHSIPPVRELRYSITFRTLRHPS